MRHISKGIIVTAAVVRLANAAGAAGPPSSPLTRCAVDAVVSGAGCMDKYEASVWRVPDPLGVNRSLVRRIQQGRASVAQLAVGGATQLGIGDADDYAPCAKSGQNCTDDIYAVSVPGVRPSANITWFQAQQACTNSRKRLPSSAEWQAAVAGTPDPGGDDGTTECNTTSAFDSVATGSRAACVSARGAFDMVGNLEEWMADWEQRSNVCGFWSVGVSPTGDNQCLAGAETTGEPAAVLRGGGFFAGSRAGPLAVLATLPPSGSNPIVGFRCAR